MQASVDFSYADPTDPKLRRLVIRGIERLTGIATLSRLYEDCRARPDPEESFFAAGVRLLRLSIDVEPAELRRIPATGPLVVVANHPFGVVDGCVLAARVGRQRPDFRIVAHGLLAHATEAAKWLLPIDFGNRADAACRNVAVRRAAIDWLKQGHVILVFPAGAVASTPHVLARRAVDERWKPFVARLVQAAAAPVVRFSGQNSRLFQLAARLSPTLRTALLFNEVHNKIGATIGVSIGELQPFTSLAGLRDRQALADHLRALTDALPEIPARTAGRPAAAPAQPR